MATDILLVLLLSLIGAFSGVAQAQPGAPTDGPFTLSARWSQYLHRTFGPTGLAIMTFETALDQGLREPACWDASANAYAQRYARAFDRRLIRNTTELAAGILTGEDLRYRKSQSHSIRGRAWNALRASMVAHMPDGTARPAYSRFFANVTTELSTAHWTGQPIRAPWVGQSIGFSALNQVETNLLDEFGPDIRRIGMSLWRSARNRADRHRRP
jgi:hypothetical protein